MSLTMETAAERFNGIEYPARELYDASRELAEAGLVIAVGESDDILSFYGAISDDASAGEVTTVLVDRDGIIPDYEQIKGEYNPEEMRAWLQRQKRKPKSVTAKWTGDVPAWEVESEIPHLKFTVMEDGEPFSQGIIFRLADAGWGE